MTSDQKQRIVRTVKQVLTAVLLTALSTVLLAVVDVLKVEFGQLGWTSTATLILTSLSAYVMNRAKTSGE